MSSIKDIVEMLEPKISKIWNKASTLTIPSKKLAIYNKGDDTYEIYAVVNDEYNYITLGSIIKSNNNRQIFIVNKIHITNDINDNYYSFSPIKFSDDGNVYKSPIMPLECSGSKLQNTKLEDQKFVLNEILLDKQISLHLKM